MARRTKDDREVRRYLEESGVTILGVQNGVHRKYKCEIGGKRLTFVVSITPSDVRSMRNTKAMIKRAVKDATKQQAAKVGA